MIKQRFLFHLRYVLDVPLITWVLLGFFSSYILFFLYPVFLSGTDMQFFNYVPAMNPIGIDLEQTLGFSETWLVTNQYIGIYPPLTRILFAPLLIVNFLWAYKLIIFSTVFCYVVITFIMPLRLSKGGKFFPLIMLISLTGIFSYGFQFELERGQFNLIAVSICFIAIWLYHYHNRYRLLAYILFTISIQLKIYPIIFIFMFINNWQDWRNNLLRLVLLGTLNFALFFILGPSIFLNFFRATILGIINPYIWIGNHSIRSFVSIFSILDYNRGWVFSNQWLESIQILLLLTILGCISLIIVNVYKEKQEGINPLLLLACSLGALLIPSVSHDYTLSILCAPVAIFLSDNKLWYAFDIPHIRIRIILLILLFSAAYSSTLFSYTNKPLILMNNFPALIVMLLVITFLSLVYKSRNRIEVSI